MQRRGYSLAAVLFLVALVIAAVASVPTSVLVQNSELGANAHHHNSRSSSNIKVKRSSNDAATSAAAALNKKSNPEIVPAAYSGASGSAGSVQAYPKAPNPLQGSSSSEQHVNLPSNADIINSAIAAGLTAAAVEAAAAESQRDLELQQQQQQQYADDLGLSNDETPTLLRKRGINSQPQQQQYLYGGPSYAGYGGYGYASGNGNGYGYANGVSDYYQSPLMSSLAASANGIGAGGVLDNGSDVPNGVWADELSSPQGVYADWQDFGEYAPRAVHHNKAYDNLQNLLNSESYLEPGWKVGPLNSYDEDKNKRAPYKKYNRFMDPRLKRDTKLTPADMLALVALVEAGERSRKDEGEADDVDGRYAYPNSYDGAYGRNGYYQGGNIYDYNQPELNYEDMRDYNVAGVGAANGAGNWMEPGSAAAAAAASDYYGSAYNLENLPPKYELLPREPKFGHKNRYAAKRFMVAKKKKRSVGKFLNEPANKATSAY